MVVGTAEDGSDASEPTITMVPRTWQAGAAHFEIAWI